jgi:ketosteroid isomerase-like protein
MGRGADVFRRFHEAWTAGEVAAAVALTDPDVVVHPLHGALFTREAFRGHEGIADWYREMTEPWDRFEAIVEDVRDTPMGAKGVVRVVGYREGDPFHARIGVGIALRDGLILTLVARNVDDVERELADSE